VRDASRKSSGVLCSLPACMGLAWRPAVTGKSSGAESGATRELGRAVGNVVIAVPGSLLAAGALVERFAWKLAARQKTYPIRGV